MEKIMNSTSSKTSTGIKGNGNGRYPKPLTNGGNGNGRYPKPLTNGGNGNGRFLGPLANLSEYVPEDWWNLVFDKLYLMTDADVVEDPEITREEVDMAIEILGLEEGYHILDLCCGQGRHSLELARRRFSHLYGLDNSRYLIELARRRAKNEELSIQFREGDAIQLPYGENKFDAVMLLGNSFGYFHAPRGDLIMLGQIYRALKPKGKFLMDVADGDYLREHFQPRSWEWLDQRHYACRERQISPDSCLVTREIVAETRKGVIADKFYSERLYSRQVLVNILESRSFGEITVHNFSPNSKRNQDLGMMAQRLIIGAVKI